MRIAFADSSDSPFFPVIAKELEGFNFLAMNRHELSKAKDLDVLVSIRGHWGRDELVDLPIALLQRCGVGVDTVDLAAMNQLGIWVANVPSLQSSNADSVADLVVFLLLGVARYGNELARSARDGKWNYPIGNTLKGKTVCLVGMGGIGLSVAQRLQGFGVRLIGVRKNPAKIVPQELHFESVYPSDSLQEALSKSHCVILSATSDASTTHLIGEAELAAMPPNGLLVNVGRGSLVDETALLNALNTGHLAGAGLDVFEHEPLHKDDPLLKHPHVFATPHCGGTTQESMYGIAAYVGENLRQFAAGKRFGSIVNEPFHPRVKLI